MSNDISEDGKGNHNVFAGRTPEESRELHPSSGDHISVLKAVPEFQDLKDRVMDLKEMGYSNVSIAEKVELSTASVRAILYNDDSETEELPQPEPEPEVLNSQDLRNAAEALRDQSKKFMQGFLYLEKACEDAAQLCMDAADALEATANTTNNNEGDT